MGRDFGWDLPPGVRSCDLPGNSAAEIRRDQMEDQAAEEVRALTDEGKNLRVEHLEVIVGYAGKSEKWDDLAGSLCSALAAAPVHLLRDLVDHWKAIERASGLNATARHTHARAAIALILNALEAIEEHVIEERTEELMEPPG